MNAVHDIMKYNHFSFMDASITITVYGFGQSGPLALVVFEMGDSKTAARLLLSLFQFLKYKFVHERKNNGTEI